MPIPLLVSAFAPVLAKVLDRVIADPEKRRRAEAELHLALVEQSASLESHAAAIIRAEAGANPRCNATGGRSSCSPSSRSSPTII